jgi:peptidyl-prolyl cis-trans isomerase C
MRLLSASVVSASLLVAACGDANAPAAPGAKVGATVEAGEPIATIGKSVLTVEGLQKRLDEQSPFVRARYAETDKKKEFLDSQVRFEVLAAEAVARGYDQDPEVQEAVKKIIVQKLTREEFDSRVKMADIGDVDLKAYYDAHKADYDKPEMVRASHIAFAFGADAATKAAAQKLAAQVQKKAAEPSKKDDKNFFRDLAAEHSTDEATKRAGGDLRYLSAADVEERFGPAANAWLFGQGEVNDTSGVIEGKDAFHVFKRTGKRQAIVRTYEQVKNQIKNVVYREKRTEAFNTYITELKTKYGVVVHEDKLSKIKVAPAPALPMDDGHGHGRDPHAGMDIAPVGEQGGGDAEAKDVAADPGDPAGDAP